MSGMYWGVGRDSRYSGARRGIWGIREYWELLGGVVVLGPLWGFQGVPEGVRVYWGWQRV